MRVYDCGGHVGRNCESVQQYGRASCRNTSANLVTPTIINNHERRKNMALQEERQYELSRRMYKVLYPNDKPNYTLTKEQFMQLLFIQDELSMNPLLSRPLNVKDN